MNQPPRFFVYRHKNKSFIAHKMNTIDWEANDNTKDLSSQSKYSMEQLKAMQLVAKMKEVADKAGTGFVGGFISPTGERFMMSNIEEGDVQHQAIKMRLDQMQIETMLEQQNEDS